MTFPSFNWETAVSSFDRDGTILKQLKSMEDAFKNAGLENCEVVDETASSLKLKFTFADGSSLTTSAIDIKGAKGDAATVAVGTTTTLPAGSSASVTNSGSSSAAVFNFGIPKGDKGDTGAAGGITNINGYTGPVTTGNGLAFNSGALSSYDFNLSDTGAINMTTITKPTGVTNLGSSFGYALNADKSIGKLYGYVSIAFGALSETQTILIPLGITVAAPATGYNINTGCWAYGRDDADSGFGLQFNIDTSGNVSLRMTVGTSQASKRFWLPYAACIYFFKDFGDNDNRMMRSLNDPTVQEER